MGEGFVENIKVLSEWEAGGELFRLVNLGAGPDVLQVNKHGLWVKESECYEWGVITKRVAKLSAQKESIGTQPTANNTGSLKLPSSCEGCEAKFVCGVKYASSKCWEYHRQLQASA